MRASLLLTPLLLASASCFFFACSSSESTAAPTTTDSGNATPLDDAGSRSDAPSDATIDPGGTQALGFIFAISDSTTAPDGGARADHRAGASFVRQTGVDTTTTSKTVGPCLIETIGDGDAPTEVDVSAGTVRISGGAKTVELTPDAAKTYEPVSGSLPLWNGGETLAVTGGDGKGVPAFTISAVAPGKLMLAAPALPSSAESLSVTRSAPFSATWTGASVGDVILYFEATTSSNAYSATCTFLASDGSGQVPAAAFADFPAGEGSFSFYAKNVGVASPPGWKVRFTASSVMVDSTGAGAIGGATFK